MSGKTTKLLREVYRLEHKKVATKKEFRRYKKDFISNK